MKKIFACILAALTVSAMLASCGNNTVKDTNDTNDNNNAVTDNSGSDNTSDEIKVGVIQYVSHPSLDNCYAGVEAALNASDKNIKIDRQIGSDAAADSDCGTYAANMVSQKYDMIVAIATPAALSSAAATDGTDIPVIFCAVNDPVVAELVESMEKPGYACTGTSDVLDLEAQVNLIQSMQPDVKKIGILYTTSEANSISNLERFKKICADRDIEVVATGIQNDADIPAAATALASQVDCINNFTDNKVVNNLTVVLDAANDAGIPVYGSEVEQVKNGCLAAVSIDYVALGNVTGEMALDVLDGEDPAEMAVRTITDATPVVNTEVLEALGMTMPESYENAETVTTNK